MTEIGRVLTKIRMNNNESSKDMARKLYISPSYLSSIESGNRKVPDYLIERVCETYCVSDLDKMKLNNQGKVLVAKRVNLTDFAYKKYKNNG